MFAHNGPYGVQLRACISQSNSPGGSTGAKS